MKRKVALFLGILLLLSIVGAIGWLYLQEKESHLKETFVPHHSAMVLQLNKSIVWTEEITTLLAGMVVNYQDRAFFRVVDTLRQKHVTASASSLLAFWPEEKDAWRTLYIASRDEYSSRGAITDFLKCMLQDSSLQERRVGVFRMYTGREGDEELSFAMVGKVLLLSDSPLFLEKALRQGTGVGAGEPGSGNMPSFLQAERYFSSSAGINLYLNSTFFSEWIPAHFQQPSLPVRTSVSRWFTWGALDVELKSKSMTLNGFTYVSDSIFAFPKVFSRQQPGEGKLDRVLPETTLSVEAVYLSNVEAYLEDLKTYRSQAGIEEAVLKQKQHYERLFGKEIEEWNNLMQGEMVKGVLGYRAAKQEGIVVLHLKSGSLGNALLQKMVAHYARQSKLGEASLRQEYKWDDGRKVNYYVFPAADFCGTMWGDLFYGMPVNYAFVQDNYLVFASSGTAVQHFFRDYARRSGIGDVEWYKKIREELATKYNRIHISDISPLITYYQDLVKGELAGYLQQNRDKLSLFSWGNQWVNEGEMLYQTLFVNLNEGAQKEAQVVWQTKLDAEVTMKPVVVSNHNTGEQELLVQDRLNNLYLVNHAGRILWKLALPEEINSEIYQVDAYKNGKLQYLFSTRTHLYLIDRNGNYLPRYPLTLKSPTDVGITLYDYDRNRDYRIFVPDTDQYLHLYDINGNVVTGWGVPKSDNTIVTRLYHYRVGGKDYLVYADQYRLYILDRRGGHRVKADYLFALLPNTPLYLTIRNGQSVIAFSDTHGDVHWIGLDGKKGVWKNEQGSSGGFFNVGDVNADGVDEWIFTFGNRLVVYSNRGKMLYERFWEGAALGYPYLYRFSTRDTRIGLLDRLQEQLILTRSGRDVEGFPIPGATPFSVTFLEQGLSGFYLFSGSRDGRLLKYRMK